MPPGGEVTRRRVLVRCAQSCGVGGAAAALFFWAALRRRPHRVALVPSFSQLAGPFRSREERGYPAVVVAREKSLTSPRTGEADPEAVKAALGRAVAALGGIERFVRPGDSVLVKPNAGFSTHPSTGAIVDPSVVAAVITLCRAAGAQRVVVTDNPIATPHVVFERTGLSEAVRNAGGRIVVPRKDHFRVLAIPGAEVLPPWPVLAGPFAGVNVVVGIAAVKDHNLCGASLTLKNWYGLLGGTRSRFHQHIDETLCDLWRLIQPARPLLILDGLRALVRNGPTGGSPRDVVLRNTLCVGTDPVAVDAFGVTLLDRDPHEISYLGKAEKEGFGSRAFKDSYKEV